VNALHSENLQAAPGAAPAQWSSPVSSQTALAGGGIFLSLLGAILGEASPENNVGPVAPGAPLTAGEADPAGSERPDENSEGPAPAKGPAGADPAFPVASRPAIARVKEFDGQSGLTTKYSGDPGVLAASSATPSGTALHGFLQPSLATAPLWELAPLKAAPVKPGASKSGPLPAGQSNSGANNSKQPDPREISPGDVFVTGASPTPPGTNATRVEISCVPLPAGPGSGPAEIPAQSQASAPGSAIVPAAGVAGVASGIQPTVAGLQLLPPLSPTAFLMRITPEDPPTAEGTWPLMDVQALTSADRPPEPALSMLQCGPAAPSTSTEWAAGCAPAGTTASGRPSALFLASGASFAGLAGSAVTARVTDQVSGEGEPNFSESRTRSDAASLPPPAGQEGWQPQEIPSAEGAPEAERIRLQSAAPASSGKASPAARAQEVQTNDSDSGLPSFATTFGEVSENTLRDEKPPAAKLGAGPSDSSGPAFASATSTVPEGRQQPESSLEPSSTAGTAPSSSATAEPDSATPLSGGAPQPLRQISLKLESPGSANVDVQLTQTAGRLAVAVRTPDPQLTQSLQSGLGDLVGRLQDRGFKTDTWIPSAHPVTAVAQSSNAAGGHTGADHKDSEAGRQQQQRQNGSGDTHQRQRERWTAQLKRMLAEEPGEDNA